jgi:xylulokinase
MATLIASIDCGSSLIKAGIIDLNGRLVCDASRETPCAYKNGGGVEIEPDALIACVFSALKEAVEKSGASPADIAALAVSSQRASVLGLDAEGKPVGNIISWQDMRGKAGIDNLKKRICDADYYNITGIPNNPLFTLSKILFIKNNSPDIYKKISKFTLLCGYINKAFGCADAAVDISNASLTGIFDISSLRWSRKIIEMAGISKDKLPQLMRSGIPAGAVSGHAAPRCGLLKGTPIISGAGDQQCALIGTGALSKGSGALTLGTASVLMGLTRKVFKDPEMKIFCTHGSLDGVRMLEGFQSSAGAGVNWLRRTLLAGREMPEKFLREIAAIKPGAGGIIFYPYFAGAAAPNWNPEATGLCLGLKFSHTPASIARALFESIAMETRGISELFKSAGVGLREIRITGGLANIETLNQIIADALNKNVSTLVNPEASLLGAAVLAACGAGIYGSAGQAVAKMTAAGKTYFPDRENAEFYSNLFKKYNEIYISLNKGKVFKKLSVDH